MSPDWSVSTFPGLRTSLPQHNCPNWDMNPQLLARRSNALPTDKGKNYRLSRWKYMNKYAQFTIATGIPK